MQISNLYIGSMIPALLVTTLFNLFPKKSNHSNKVTPIILGLLLIITVVNCFILPTNSEVHWGPIAFGFDTLTRILLTFILFLGMLVTTHAGRYLRTEVNQSSFMLKISGILTGVITMALSANLLTFFIGWLIAGLMVSWTLAYYPHKAAQDSARLKLACHLIGDVFFVIALVLIYKDIGTSDFALLAKVTHPALIGLCLVVAVMAKCAQFPFHRWLLNTMDAPTSLSGLMHAGIINAGGILLTRTSPIMTSSTLIMMLITAVGIVSAGLGAYRMLAQTDIKQKLAYSTISQMGYMLIQCGIGLFSAAIFHLMAHGFYKVFLFLNSGNTLETKAGTVQHTWRSFVLSSIVALVFLSLCLFLTKGWLITVPIIFKVFIFISLQTVVMHILKQRQPWKVNALSLGLLLGMMLIYCLFLGLFEHWIGHYNVHIWLNEPLQALMGIGLIIFHYIRQVHHD